MEIPLSTPATSNEMGSQGLSVDQDARAMVAPGTTARGVNGSISRSITRYKGNRRNMNLSPSRLPVAPDLDAQNLSTRYHLNDRDGAVPHRPNFPKNMESQPKRRAQHVAQSPSRPNRQLQDGRQERQEGGSFDGPNNQKSRESSEPIDHDVTVQDMGGSKKAHAIRTKSGNMEDRGASASIQLKKNSQNTIYTVERMGEGTLRPMYERSAHSQEAVLPPSNPVPVPQSIRQKLTAFSLRTEKQVPRPQAFEKSNSRTELKRMISGPVLLEPNVPPVPPQGVSEEPIVVPRFDAPISAVNAGSRMVRVKYEMTEVSVPITPFTTPVDVIQSAARQIPASIDGGSTVLLESFKQVGLERPLRKYEHIRDVLNSWDYDAQNALVIVASPTGGKDDDLDVKNVSKSQPSDTSVHLYHSQKPGHWDKRWIFLRTDGQVLVSKKNGGETANICHLSDFDIYIPTPRYSAKKIKPPKKICFAVKSQQKSSMFMSTVNFVHFFSTSDRQLATSWYKAVQEWRSWYLVTVMGEGQKARHVNRDGTTNGMRQEVINDNRALQPSHQILPDKASRAQNPKSTATTTTTFSAGNPTIKSGPSSHPRKLAKDPSTSVLAAQKPKPDFIQQPSAQPSSADTFAPTSLLGRTYTQRQKAQRRSSQENPLPPAPSSSLVQQPTSTASPIITRKDNLSTAATAGVASTNVNIKRTSSTRHPQHQMPKPLVDLTPQYQPPPQHMRKGRGVKPEQIPAGGLVEVATSPEIAIQIPPSRDWRRPGAAGAGRGGSVSPPKRDRLER
ncbi:MAG: hypothetical protein Q9195_006511 [Heterodermia aff. obscurata]